MHLIEIGGLFGISDSEEILWEKLNQLCASRYGVTSILYGFCHSFYTSKRTNLTKSLILKHNHPKEYIDSLGEENFLNNGASAHAIIYDRHPFIWHRSGQHAEITKTQKDQIDVDIRFNMNVGVSFSLPFANNRGIGGLGMCMGSMTIPEFEALWTKYQSEMVAVIDQFDQLMRPAMVNNRIKLSPREREVLAYSAGGMLAKEIAAHLGLKTKTIYNTLERARNSMQAASTMEAVAKAYVYDLI